MFRLQWLAICCPMLSLLNGRPMSRTHNATLDYARLIAAFGIVLFHAKAPSGSIGYAALPFFTMLLLIHPPRPQAFSTYAKSRAARLLYPWLIWSAVYGALKVADALSSDQPIMSEFAPWMIVTGPAIHLWFLPFAFVACVVAFKFTPSLPVIAGLSLVAFWALDRGLPAPFAQWVFVMPAAMFGLAAGRHQLSSVIVAGVIVVWFCSVAGWNAGLMQFTIAGATLLLCMAVKMPETRLSHFCASTSMGVYLVHPIALSFGQRIAHVDGMMLWVIACVASLAFASAAILIRSGPESA